MRKAAAFFSQKLKQTTFKTWCKTGVVLLLVLWFVFSLPSRLFNTPTSFVIEDVQGNLLGATIAADGQWRFPYNDSIPDKFKQCIIAFEDKRFAYHPGVDPAALARAIWQNLRGNKVVSGGSTLTMQVVRLSRRKNRTVLQKAVEAIQAFRVECSYSKNEILALYAANAPFGSNVVGLDAAAWRYFGRSADKLSWAEVALLAVLPNAPSLVHPGKNRTRLLRKRNMLIDKLATTNTIDQATADLAKSEPLPAQPLPLPMLAPHLLNRFKKEYPAGTPNQQQTTRIVTTVQSAVQQNVTQLINRYHHSFKGNGINNAAAMVLEVSTGNVLAYVGNVYDPANAELESHVDVLAAPRSPGSTLKPLLFEAVQHDGLLLPKQLIPDIPTQVGGYTPQNFNLEYDGAVPANRALSRSLNIPAVKMLQQYKYPRFYNVLKQAGFTTLKQPAEHYGLSLILGGCEVTPWELAGVYSSMARSYLNQRKNQGKVVQADWHMPVYKMEEKVNKQVARANAAPINFVDYTSVWHTLNAMQEVMRPGEEGLWNLFGSAQRIAWKTGTSFGFRDGWAIGITPKYCVVVWVGNTDGEGRAELTGINTAAPLMFDIFRTLPASAWFEPPAYDFAYLPVCHQSGFKAGRFCNNIDTVLVSDKGINAPLCPYHRVVNLDQTATFRVTENCSSPSAMVQKSWFVLPPGMEFYYKQRHQDYQVLPSFLPGCSMDAGKPMELVYPDEHARLYVPVELTGEQGNAIFTAAHRNTGAKIFWHLDDQYIATTIQFHQVGVRPAAGKHTITIVDEQGERVTRNFVVLAKEKP